MIAAIRSEWIKLSTITVTWILAIVAVAFPFVVTVLTAAFADEPSGETLAGVVTGTTVVSGMLLGVIASIGITNEFSHNTIRPTFAAMPDRWRPLLAKPTVHVALTFLLTAVVVALSWAVGRVIAGDSASTDTEGTAAALIGVVLLAVGLTLLGYGLGLLLRNTAATVCLLLLWPLIAEGLIAGLLTAVGAEDATKWLPYGAGINMAVVDSSGEETLGRVPGGLYFIAWVVAITAFGLWSAHRRDA